MIRRVTLLLFVGLLALIFAGCSHALEVRILDKYQAFTANSLNRPVKIGIVGTGQTDQKLLVGIGSQLGAYGASVVMPYVATGKPADVVASIGVNSTYEGSGWNFLINWPGFLIFTPAWHGYNYTISHSINVQLNRGTDNEQIATFSLPVVLNIRHAAINRTWTEIGWLELGVIPLIGGIFFIAYDDNVTPLAADKARVSIGTYVAQEMVNRINGYKGEFAKVVPPPEIENVCAKCGASIPADAKFCSKCGNPTTAPAAAPAVPDAPSKPPVDAAAPAVPDAPGKPPVDAAAPAVPDAPK